MSDKPEIKWVDGIITGMNTPDQSGYAIVRDGVVESYAIPAEYNWIIKQTLEELAALKSTNARLQEEKNVLREVVRELLDAMRRYEMDVAEEAPYKHREMIKKAKSALERTGNKRGNHEEKSKGNI